MTHIFFIADTSHCIWLVPYLLYSKLSAMKKILCAACLLFVMASCNTSKITTSWKSENVNTEKYNKILVIGLIRENDRTLRERMEQHLVGDLQDLGYTAVSVLKEYGPKAFDNMTEAAVLDTLKSSGVDAVVTIVLLDKAKEKNYVPARVYYTPYGYYHTRFFGYYGALNRRIYEPDYYVINTKYFWESNLYEMKKGLLVYSVQTESFDPASTESMAHEYGKMIVKDMVKKTVLLDSAVKTTE